MAKIGGAAFAGCMGLQSLTISDGVTEIEQEAFKGCTGLTSITIPDKVKSIGKESFADCSSLQAFKVTPGNRVYKSVSGLVLSRDGARLVAVPADLTSVTIPEGVEVIGPWSFSGCSRLTSVTIPDGLMVIGDGAFAGCSGLVSVTIPNGVTSIGDGAFAGCSGLASMTIPASVTNIGEDVFKDCRQLPSIIFSTKFGSNYMASSGHELARTLIKRPELAEKYDLGLLQGDDWAYLLSRRPELADKCVLWGMLNEDDWATLLKRQPQLSNNRLDGRCTEIEIETNFRVYGVSRYSDVAKIEHCIKEYIPITKPIYFRWFASRSRSRCFALDAVDSELTYIDTCMIHFKNREGTLGSVEIGCHLTESGPLLSCNPQINVVRTGGWKDPCRRAGRTVPVAYARELAPWTRSFKIKGDFDPRKLTVVVEDGFLRCIRYDGCVVTEVLPRDYLDALRFSSKFSSVYRYSDGGKVSFGKQCIDFAKQFVDLL